MIDHTPSHTRCYCGSAESFEFCSTCRSWLIERSPWIVAAWRSWLRYGCGSRWPLSTCQANAAESDDLAFFLSWRYSRNDQ